MKTFAKEGMGVMRQLLILIGVSSALCFQCSLKFLL